VRVLVGLRIAQPARERLQQRPRHLGMLFDERFELPDRKAVAEEIGRRSDGRRAGAFVDERDLAEVVAGPESGPHFSADADRRISLDDDEESGRAGPLGGHRRALGEAPFLHLARQAFQVVVGQAGEERHLAESVNGRRGHARGF
jgi:hypothetical protein